MQQPAHWEWGVQWAANRKAHRGRKVTPSKVQNAAFAFGTLPDYLRGRLEGIPRVVDISLAADRASELPDLLAALKTIPANIDRTQWWEIGAAIHWWDPSEFGLEIWKRWSSTSENPDHQDWNEACERQWADYGREKDPGKPLITLGTLYATAKEHGWTRLHVPNANSSHSESPDPKNASEGVHADSTAGHDEKNQQHSAGEDRKTKENAAGGDHYDEDSLLPDEGVALNDFYAHMPTHGYIFAPSRELWPASSVNARIAPVALFNSDGKPVLDAHGNQKRISPSAWLDQNRSVEQMSWAPSLPLIIRNRLISEGGWIERNGVHCFNLYRPPTIEPGNAAEADRWLDHIYKVFGDHGLHIIKWLAHRTQQPAIKINHAIVLGGAPGIGKDTLLEPVKYAVGPWNFIEVSPQQVLGRFNGFLKSTVLRVSEARDLGQSDRFKFYDHMKAYTAAPPDVLRVDEKNLREHSIFNCCGVIITTNYKADGIYLAADDRRHYVGWSDLTKEDFPPSYWNALWGWYARGGIWHVAAYLAELDISSFDPKAPPSKTQAFWDIVDAHRAPEDAELADVLDRMGNPDATTLNRIESVANGEFKIWIMDRKNRRIIPHRLEKCGYVHVRNDGAKDGLWKINGARQVIYAKSTLSIRDRHTAADGLVKLSTSAGSR